MTRRLPSLLAAAVLLAACAGPKPSPKVPPPPAPKPTPRVEAPPSALPQPAPLTPARLGLEGRADVQGFIDGMAHKHGFSADRLRRVFAQVGIQDAVLAAIAKPYEAKPWYAYKKLFLTDTRIQNGIEFRKRNAQALARAEAKYGVSPAIISAIIGIESAYGQKPGNYRAIDALATLGFDYPRRAAFFRSELEQFLLLCRDEGMDPLQPLSSYAGAMGMPQFMPSSYRKLAADGDGDGKRDIWDNPADAIASVARYFAANGWHTGEPIAVAARVEGDAYHSLVSRNPKANHSLAQLSALGVSAEGAVPGHLQAGLVRLDEEDGPAYWLGFHNFQVVMRYNHSPLYAMAAYELSRRLGPD